MGGGGVNNRARNILLTANQKYHKKFLITHNLHIKPPNTHYKRKEKKAQSQIKFKSKCLPITKQKGTVARAFKLQTANYKLLT
jgi:hypothetical protein